MATKFTSIWNEKKPVAGASASGGRAAAASASADSESGIEGRDSAARSLRALKVMLDRGLMTQDEYDQKKLAILSGGAG